MYGLPENYRTNPACKMDQASRDASRWQLEVYRFAQQLMLCFKLRSILDIGCGVPEKLEKYIKPISTDITGLDLPHTIDAFKDRYFFGQWRALDIEGPVRTFNREFDVILTSDVIEHLEDPDRLLSFIKHQSSKGTYIILSTPERDTLGVSNFGPPINHYHVREWNQKEFIEYIKSRGFNVIESFLASEPAGYKCHVCVCNYSAN